MNASHSVTGAVAALAVQPALWALDAHQPVQLGAHGLVLVAAGMAGAGAATLPDIDHPDSITSVYLPPATTALSWAVHKAAGGHRKAAHWLYMAPVAGGLLVLPAILWPHWGGVVAGGLLAGLGLWAAKVAHHLDAILAGLAVVFVAGLSDPTGGLWLAPVVAAGYVAHILGDRFFGGTIGRDGKRDRYGSLKTGGWVEKRLVRPAFWGLLVLVSLVVMFPGVANLPSL
jgi:hypothetical protein